MRLRKPFKYGYGEILDYLLKFKCFRLKSYRNLTYYDKGKQMLAKELDIVNIVRSMRDLKHMSDAILGPKERMLLKFQR